MAQRAIRLDGSDEVLEWPNGDVEQDVLETILYDAIEKGIDKQRPVLVIHRERVENFNPDNPRWKDVPYRRKLQELLRLYEDLTGKEYRGPTSEERELEREYQNKVARRDIRAFIPPRE